MPDEDVSKLLMLTSDQIDYGSLSPQTLADLALGGDPYIASMALSELELRSVPLLLTTARRLVEDVAQDDDTRAFALSLLARNDDLNPEWIASLGRQAGPELQDEIGRQLAD